MCSFLEHLEGVKQSPVLVFVCGGNSEASPSKLSYRRQKLIEFLNSSSEYFPILAEEVFKHHTEENLLKIEKIISNAVDRIVIILESQSSFVELGAFSSDLLRDKLVVINDSTYDDEESFINIGPLKQIYTEDKTRVIKYRFLASNKDDSCPIGQVFPKLGKVLLESKRESKRKPSLFDFSQETLSVSPHSIFLLHDIIYLFGPLDYKDIVDVYKSLYPKVKSFDPLKTMRGMLSSMDVIEDQVICGEKAFRSKRNMSFFKYHRSVNKLIARAKITQFQLGRI